VLGAGERKGLLAYKEQYPGASHCTGVNPSISQRHVKDILSENKKCKDKTCKTVKCLKGAEIEHLEDRTGKCEKWNSN
jgi:hypothetical protein